MNIFSLDSQKIAKKQQNTKSLTFVFPQQMYFLFGKI